MSKKVETKYRMISAETLISRAQEYNREKGFVKDGDFTDMYIDGANMIINMLIKMEPLSIEVPSFTDERLVEMAKIREHDAGYFKSEENIEMFVGGANMALDEINKLDRLDLELEVRYMQVDLEERYE